MTSLAVRTLSPDSAVTYAEDLLKESSDPGEVYGVIADLTYLRKRCGRLHDVRERIAETKLRAERKLGELLDSLPREQGARTDLTSSKAWTKFQAAIEAAGIPKSTAYRLREIAAIPAQFFEGHISDVKARREELTTTGLLENWNTTNKRAEKEKELSALREGNPPLPTGHYRAVILDPPWNSRRTEPPYLLDYPTQTLDEIAAVPPPVDPDGGLVFMWVTQHTLPDGFDLFERWGIKYHCLMTWKKPGGMTPYSFCFNAEHVLVGFTGELTLLKLGLPLCFDAPRGKHSEKPEHFYDIIREVAPRPILEMHAREKREGIDAFWGNDPHIQESATPGGARDDA